MNKIKIDKFDMGCISDYRNQLFGVAIIWIMLLHGSILDKVSFIEPLVVVQKILAHGNVGVDIFLFLSGIGLYFSYSRNQNLGNYVVRRFSRVLIPYLIVAIPAFIVLDLVMEPSKKEFFCDITQLSFWFEGDPLLWYVPGILFCYLLFPLVFGVLYEMRGNLLVKTVIIVFAWMVFTFCFLKALPDAYNNMEKILTRIPVFIVGCAAGKLVHERRKISSFWIFAAIAIAIDGFIIVCTFAVEPLILQRYFYFAWALGLVFSLTFVLWALRKCSVLGRILNWFGNYSLEFYIVHIVLRHFYMHSVYYGGYVWTKYIILLMISVPIGVLIGIVSKQLSRIIIQKLV